MLIFLFFFSLGFSCLGCPTLFVFPFYTPFVTYFEWIIIISFSPSFSFHVSFLLFSALAATGFCFSGSFVLPFSIKGCLFFFISSSAGSVSTLLWYQSSSFEELCCALCLPLFLHLYTYFLHVPFLFFLSAKSATMEPSANNYLYLHMQWVRCNNMVLSKLVNSISLPIRQSVIWMDIVVYVWNDLKTRYSQGDLSRISDLQLEASSLSQNDLSVTDYFTKLRIIWDELDNFRPNPISLQKNWYVVVVIIWRLLKTTTINCIIRQLLNRHNLPSKCGV